MKISIKRGLAILLAVIGLASFIAGCGGNRIIVEPPRYPTAVLIFRTTTDQNPQGSGTLSNETFQISFTISNGEAILKDIRPGVYRASGRVNGWAFSEPIIVNNEVRQNFFMMHGDVPGITITGKLYLNTGDPVTGRCTNASPTDALTDRVLIRARNRNSGLITATILREKQPANTPVEQKGAFRIGVQEGNYILEVRQAPPISVTEHSPSYSGNSVAFTTPRTTSVSICVNEGTTPPIGNPTPAPTTSPTPGPSPTPTPGGPPPVPTPTQVGPPPPPFGNKRTQS